MTDRQRERHTHTLPDDLEDAVEVGLDLVDGLVQEPAVGPHTHVGHTVHGNQRLQETAQRMERGVTRLEVAQRSRSFRFHTDKRFYSVNSSLELNEYFFFSEL